MAEDEVKTSDGVQGWMPPPAWTQEPWVALSLAEAIANNVKCSVTPQYMGVRSCLATWKELGADHVLLRAIEVGVRAPLPAIPKPQDRMIKPEDIEVVRTCVKEYLEQGAVVPLDNAQMVQTKYWVPIFTRAKKDSGKQRLITDLRLLNVCSQPRSHKTQSWPQVMQVLRDNNLSWGVKIDLKNWFHHLGVHQSTKRWLRFKVDQIGYQVAAMPFGWSMSPWWANKLSKPLQAWMNKMGIPHLWYVDDILVLGENKMQAEAYAARLVSLFSSTGICVNGNKSMTEASQSVVYLGHILDLQANLIRHQEVKNQGSLKMVNHLLSGNNCAPKLLAGLAGNLLDAIRSNVKLEGLPQHLLKCNSGLVRWQAKRLGVSPYHPKCWGLFQPKTKAIQECLAKVSQALMLPLPRVLRPSTQGCYLLSSDASKQGWGAILLQDKQVLARYSGFWEPSEAKKHITYLEVKASALGLARALLLVPLGSEVLLKVDSICARHAWAKGSKLAHLNDLVAPVKVMVHSKGVLLKCEYLPGVQNTLADWLSRNQDRVDPENYQLAAKWFHRVCNHFQFFPTVDLFASQLNHQIQRYCSWSKDHLSLGNAYALDWAPELPWANPPFSQVHRMLDKIVRDQAMVLVCLPVWPSQSWWGRLQLMQVVPPLIVKGQGLFRNPKGVIQDAPRWATLFTVVRG